MPAGIEEFEILRAVAECQRDTIARYETQSVAQPAGQARGARGQLPIATHNTRSQRDRRAVAPEQTCAYEVKGQVHLLTGVGPKTSNQKDFCLPGFIR